MLWMLGVLIDTVEEVDQQPGHLETKILNHWILSLGGEWGEERLWKTLSKQNKSVITSTGVENWYWCAESLHTASYLDRGKDRSTGKSTGKRKGQDRIMVKVRETVRAKVKVKEHVKVRVKTQQGKGKDNWKDEGKWKGKVQIYVKVG